MLAYENQNKTDAKKRKLEEVHLEELSCDEICRNIESHHFVILVKNTSTKSFENENSKALNDVFKPGMNCFINFLILLRILVKYLINKEYEIHPFFTIFKE